MTATVPFARPGCSALRNSSEDSPPGTTLAVARPRRVRPHAQRCHALRLASGWHTAIPRPRRVRSPATDATFSRRAVPRFPSSHAALLVGSKDWILIHCTLPTSLPRRHPHLRDATGLTEPHDTTEITMNEDLTSGVGIAMRNPSFPVDQTQ